MVVDVHTGEVLKSSSADSPRYPASLTKIMTLYVVFEELAAGRLKTTTSIKFSKHAVSQPPSKLGVKVGESITVDQAIRALVTKSANDVAAAVAEHIAGSEGAFARRMTETARRLGMSKSTFRNASGLPSAEQKTTARDMVTLARRITSDFPEQYKYFGLKSFSWRGRTYRNHNRLLGRYAGTDGIKTGYIRASGFNLVASVRRADKHLIAVVFGGKTARRRDAHMQALLDQAFPRAVARSEAERAHAVQLASAAPSPPRPKPQLPAIAADPIAEAQVHQIAGNRGRILLSLVATPPGSRELPLAETESRPNYGVRLASALVSGQAAPRPAEDVAAGTVSRISAGSAWRSGVAAAPRASAAPPAPAVAYGQSDRPEDLGDAIERLIAEATAAEAGHSPPTKLASAAPASRLILPSPIEPAAEDQALPDMVAAFTPQPEPIEVPDGWQIQVGAYARAGDAHAQLSTVEDAARSLLSDATPFTQPVEKGKSTLYRARFAGLDKTAAEQACRTLKKKKIACLVLPE